MSRPITASHVTAKLPRTLVGLLSVAVATLGSTRSNPAAPTRAAADPPAPVRAWMYTNRVAWRTVPSTRVTARLVDRVQGEAVAKAVADVEGDVVLSFAVPSTGERTPPGGGSPSLIEPGDTVFVTADDVPVWEIPVPDLSADAEVSPPRVHGTAPAGAGVDIAFSGAGRRSFVGSATAGADGRFELNLRDNFDLRYGDSGWVTLVDGAGHSFTVLAAPLVVEVTLGTPRARVLSSTSTQPDLWIQNAGASRAYRPGPRSADPFGTGWTAFLLLIRGDDRDALTAGSVVTATQLGDPLRDPRSRRVVVPDLALDLDVSGTSFVGRAPPGAALRITVQRPDGAPTTLATAADALGHFRIGVAGAPLPPGSKAELRYDAGNGNWFVAPLVVPQIRVYLYEDGVHIVGPPSSAVTVTWTSQQLAASYSWGRRFNSDGEFRTSLQPADADTIPSCEVWPKCFEPMSILPGDRIAVEFSAGDPVVLTLPSLTTRTDPDVETVGGVAPRGASVAIYAEPPWPSVQWDSPGAEQAPARPVTSVTAGDDGTYIAPLSPAIDIEPPLLGYTVVADHGHLVAAQWTPLIVEMMEDIAYVEVKGVAGRPISATLHAADGTTLARLDTMNAYGVLRDAVGQRPVIAPGDVLDIARGDDRLVLPIPVLDGRVHVDDDLVIGQGPPGEIVRLLGQSAPVTATVDGAGLFRHDFKADGVDLRFNDPLRAILAFGPGRRHTLNRDLSLPGLTLALHTSRLRGSIEPLLDLTIRADRGPVPLARQSVRSDGRAAFRTTLVGADGTRLALAPGDALTVEAPPTALQRRLTMAVPTLDIGLDAAADTATGRMPRDASLSLSLQHWFLSDANARSSSWNEPAPGADGQWSATFQDWRDKTVDIRPGSAIDAELRLPSGHIAEHRVAVPLLSAQADGTLVCGQAAPLADVAVTALDDAGGAMLTGSGKADDLGLFAFTLADVDGRGRTLTIDTVVRGRLGTAAVELTVPKLGVEVDWGTGVVAALTRPFGEATIEVGAHGCLGRPTGTGMDYDQRYLEADSRGRAESTDFTVDQVTAGVVAAAFTADGMRVYREAHRLVADLYIDTPRVVITTTARSPVDAALLAVDGRVLAAAAAVADDAGRADIALADVAGRGARLAAGQTVTLAALGDTARIAVEPLSVDATPSRGLVGFASPGRDVRLRLTLADGRPVDFVRQTDDRGRFVFTPSMVPPRSTWRWADVRRVEAVIALAGGHRVVSDVMLEGASGDGRGRIWLPYGHTGGRR